MPIDMDALVITALPSPNGGIEPPELPAPEGTTYLWANTTLMGEPDTKRLNDLLGSGWAFVAPVAQPDALAMPMGRATAARGFCLMEKATALVEGQRAQDRAAHMDLNIRALSILERYTGEAPRINIRGQSLRITIAKRNKDGAVAPPLKTLYEVEQELARCGFPAADICLFMQRHFGP